jgi:hypothetical protein
LALGVDIAASLLDRAREHALDARVDNIEFQHADVQSSDLGVARFDGAFSRFGVMCFADPVPAFTNVARSLKPGGVLSFVCWQAVTSNDWMFVSAQAAVSVLGTVPEMPALDAPGPFSLTDQNRVRTILDSAGFHNIDIKAHDDLMRTQPSALQNRRTRRCGWALCNGCSRVSTPRPLSGSEPPSKRRCGPAYGTARSRSPAPFSSSAPKPDMKAQRVGRVRSRILHLSSGCTRRSALSDHREERPGATAPLFLLSVGPITTGVAREPAIWVARTFGFLA